MPQKSRRQNAIELGYAQLSVVSCKLLLDRILRELCDGHKSICQPLSQSRIIRPEVGNRMKSAYGPQPAPHLVSTRHNVAYRS